jgi:hypothetical protein
MGRNRWFVDSPLKGNGFELSVPHETGSGFEASSEFWTDRLSARRYEPSSVGLGKINREVSAARGAHSPPNEAPALSAGHRGTESLRTFGSGTARRVDEGDAPRPRTASSNPFPSSGESANLRSLSGRRNPSRAQLLAHCEGKHRDRRLVGERRAGVVMGVDVARFGDVASVIRFRRGRDARSILPIKLRGADTIDRGSPGAIRKEHW